ncbi:hypothetical protein UFOVP732_51 [uncultured Caudovirales phage]|uniref:Uncharacterized protein n=1 Tax=uncultured Caudovirales phage TaxID=2100421 RepID=A0A6J5P1M2_9CAUD|nr:hypothetical protein UFOVP732_51 [uncultured Caudovirales phage]
MYNLNIEGFGSVPVGEEFLRLSQADQEAYVRRIVAERQAQQINVDQRGLGQNAGTLDRGVANIQQGAATTARRLGEAGVFPETMGAIADAVAPDPSRLQGQSAAGAMSQDFLGNLDLIPRGVMEVLPSLGGVWASAKVGGAVGGPVGAFGGAVAYTLATALGPYAEEAARNNGRTTPNREDWTRGAAAAAAEGVFERIGVRGLGRGIVGGSVREGGTELAGSQAANAVTSVGTEAGYQVPTGSELATDFTLGAGAAGTVNAGAAAVRLPGQVATAATQAIADVPRAREVAQYTDEQLVSDLRVVDAYNRRREAERGTTRFGTTNSNPDPSVTFKGIKEDYTRALEGLMDAELAAGNITKDQRDLIGREIRSARVHNQELADGATALDYFESRRELIRGMGLNTDVERVLMDGLRDLNTATYNSMMKNKTGPFARIGQRLGVAAGGAAGFAQAGPAGFLLGAATGGIGRSLGAGLDRAAGLSGPEVLARARVLSREAQKRNLKVDPIAPEIQDLTNSARTTAQTNSATQASQMAQYNAMANQMGLSRGGGWAASVALTGNEFAPGMVDLDDPIRAVEDLARAGVIDPQRADTLINDRTARPTEPEMRLITDYVVSAASQTNRETWNARPGTQAPATSQSAPSGLPDPPVTRVGNQGAYDAKMAQVNALNDAIRATATDPQSRAVAENVMGAKDKASKEAAFGQGTGDPAVDALLQAAIAMTSARSRDPGTSVSGSTTGGVSGPPSGTRARSGGFQTVQDPTRRTTQRGGLQVDPFTGNQGRPEAGRAAPGAREATKRGSKQARGGALSSASTKASDVVRDVKVEAPVITMQDLVGKKVFPIIADLTDAGTMYRGIDGSEITVPIDTQGGPNFPLLKEYNDAGIVWAVQGKGRGTAKLSKDADYGIVVSMDKNAHISNATVTNAVFSTLDAYVRDQRMPAKNVEKLATMIRDAGTTAKTKSLQQFPGFSDAANPNRLSEFTKKLSFEARKRMVQVLSSKAAQSLGAPDATKILDALRDPEFDGYNWGDSILVLQVDKNSELVNLKDAGLTPHKSYDYGIKGTVVGRLPMPMTYRSIWRDFFAQKQASRGDKKAGNDRRAFELALPVQEITPSIAGALPDKPMSSIKSAKHAQAVLDSILGNWRTTDDAKKKGGVSPQEFLDALRRSDASATLSTYTPEGLRKQVKAKDLKVYQLGQNEVYFGIANGYSYANEYGAKASELQKPHKALVSVVNNERGARGIGAASILKAVEEGATALDCYAVPSKKTPNGFLPQYYGAFGFREVERVKFDPQFILDEPGGANKMKDLEAYWRKNGWTPDQGYPDISIMVWEGSDADRKGTTERYWQEGLRGVRPGSVGSFVTAGRKHGERDDPADPGRRGPRGSDQGPPGGRQGDGDRASLGSGLQRAGLEVANLDDRGILALGLDPQQVSAARSKIGSGNRQ